MKPKLNKIYHIKWIDAHSLHGWKDKKEMQTEVKETSLYNETVGFLIEETKEAYAFAQSLDNFQYDYTMIIPKAAVIKIYEIN